MKKRVFLTLLLTFSLLTTSAQKKDSVLSGMIISENEIRIKDVCVSNDKGEVLAMTDADGFFEIPLTKTYDITLSHPRVEKTTFSMNPDDFEHIDGKYHAIIMLQSRKYDSIDYQDTTIRQESVVDYKVGKYGIFMIKTDGIKSTLQQLSFRNKVLAKLDINPRFNQIFIDVLDGIHIFSSDSSYQVFSDGENIELSNGHDLEYFENSIMTLAAVTDSLAITCVKYYYGQSVNYLMTNLNTKEQSVLCKVDSELVKHSKENYVGTLLKLRENNPDWSFWYTKNPELNKSYKKIVPNREFLSLKEVYAPIVSVDNRLYVFDFTIGSICKYNNVGTFLGNTEIAFHLSSGYATKFFDNPWNKKIIFDVARKECYAQFTENGKVILKKINLKTGNIDGSYMIESHDYPHNIQIHNGIVYYLYLDKSSGDYGKRYFYAEMIR